MIGRDLLPIGILATIVLLAITETSSSDLNPNEGQKTPKVYDPVPQRKNLKHKKYHPDSGKALRNDFGNEKTDLEKRKTLAPNPANRVRRTANELGTVMYAKGRGEGFESNSVGSSEELYRPRNAFDKQLVDEIKFLKRMGYRFPSTTKLFDKFPDDRRWKRAVFVNAPPVRTNTSDYYAQRKAVMELFYARQRQIAEKYTKEISTTPAYARKHEPQAENNSISSAKVEENLRKEKHTLSNINDNLINPINYTSSTPETRVVQATTEANVVDGLENEEIIENSMNASKVERESPSFDYSAEEEYTEDSSDPNKKATTEEENDILLWGQCKGRLIYQHNLLLSVQGSTIDDMSFVAELSGPFCVTCVKTEPFQRTRTTMMFESIRKDQINHYVKLRLRGFKDDSFTYIVKIFAVASDDHNCAYG